MRSLITSGLMMSGCMRWGMGEGVCDGGAGVGGWGLGLGLGVVVWLRVWLR
ncbi:hypothetical protein OK074_4946, partial [Actinobacteria bacterium OK074]